jgi:hypothetical protein
VCKPDIVDAISAKSTSPASIDNMASPAHSCTKGFDSRTESTCQRTTSDPVSNDLISDNAGPAPQHKTEPSGPIKVNELKDYEVKALREAKQRAATVTEQWQTLRDVVQRHENTLHRRWSKKTKGQRLKILLKAWPRMSLTHRPDFHAVRKEDFDGPDPDNTPRAGFMQEYLWPHINQEDLSRPRTLQLLLNSRGRHPPSAFAATDLDAAPLAWLATLDRNTLLPDFPTGYSITLNSVTESDMHQYGKIVARPPPTTKQFEPRHGFLILGIQERLYTFLVDCCKEILHDIPVDSWISDAFPIQPAPSIKADTDATGFPSLSVLAAEAPYRAPTELDMGAIVSLLAPRTAAAEDRQDPLFLRDQVLEAKEHLPLLIGNPRKGVPDEDRMWELAVLQVLREAFQHLEMFSLLRQQVEELKHLNTRHASSLPPKNDPPAEYLNGLCGVFSLLSTTIRDRLAHFTHSMGASPPLRHLFVHDIPSDTEGDWLHKPIRLEASCSCARRTKGEEKLIELLDIPLDSFMLSVTVCRVDELQRLVDAEPEVSCLVTPYSISAFGDLSLLTQCGQRIRFHQPWVATWPLDSVSDAPSDAEDSGPPPEFSSWANSVCRLDCPSFMAAAKFPASFKRRLPYPIEKRRTKENVEALRAAEQSLDAFWERIDRAIHKTAGNLDGTATNRLLSQNRVLQRTPEWLEPAPNGEAKATPASCNTQEVVYRPLSTLYFGLEPSAASKSTSLPPPRRNKTKTKGQPRPRTDDDTASGSKETTLSPDTPTSSDLAITVEAQPQLPVDARALKVFRVLFHNPDITSAPGEVSWTDFLHAMTSMGFEAQKLYGSSWQFQPSRPDMNMNHATRAIQFHEPHPKGKIQYWVARRYGRRLQRAYGWCGGMFVLREK